MCTETYSFSSEEVNSFAVKTYGWLDTKLF